MSLKKQILFWLVATLIPVGILFGLRWMGQGEIRRHLHDQVSTATQEFRDLVGRWPRKGEDLLPLLPNSAKTYIGRGMYAVTFHPLDTDRCQVKYNNQYLSGSASESTIVFEPRRNTFAKAIFQYRNTKGKWPKSIEEVVRSRNGTGDLEMEIEGYNITVTLRNTRNECSYTLSGTVGAEHFKTTKSITLS